MKKVLSIATVVFMLVGILSVGTSRKVFAQGMFGAIFTTNSDGSNVNQNLYELDSDVYLNGGPQKPEAAGLPDGTYYIQVTDPDGSEILGRTTTAAVTVANGEFIQRYQLTAILQKYEDNNPVVDLDRNPVMGFSQSTNGVYKVWASQNITFPNSESKTDNFRIAQSGITYTGKISGFKFNDINFNGIIDSQESKLPGWEINLYKDSIADQNLIDSQYTDLNGYYLFDKLADGTYYITETMQDGWAQTCPKAGYYTITLNKDGLQEGYADFGNTQNGELIVRKFYDANGNGKHDPGEIYLGEDNNTIGWEINVKYGGSVGQDALTKYDECIKAGTYTVSEYMPEDTQEDIHWISTTAQSVNVTLPLADKQTVEFGNVCLGEGGGLTLGFWSNKNGQAIITTSGAIYLKENVKNELDGLNLCDQEGTSFSTDTYLELKSWLLNATATNMAYMLSVQLATMKLNVATGKVIDSSLIWVGDNVWGINKAITVSELMNLADTSLGEYNNTIAGNANRAHQEFLKTALDKANNNLNFVQSTPGEYTFSTQLSSSQ